MSDRGPSRSGDTAANSSEEAAVQSATDEEIPRAGAGAHLVGSLVPLSIGAASTVYSARLGFGSFTEPGPGLWPLAVSAVLTATSVVLLIFGGRMGDYERFTRRVLPIALGVVSLTLFVVLFQRVGFELPTLLIFVFWLRFLGRESWRATILVAAGATAAFYVLFIVVLGTPLPHIAIS